MNTKMLCLAGAFALAIPAAAAAAPLSAARSADLMAPTAVTTPAVSDAMLRDTDGAGLEKVGFFHHRRHGFYHRRFFHRRFHGRHHFWHRRFFHRHRHFY